MADEKSYVGKAWDNARDSVKRRTQWTGLYGPPERALRNDPLPAFSFLVEIDMGQGKEAAALFQSASGLQFSTQVVPVGAGGVNNTTYKLVGHTEWPNLVLKKGFTNNSRLLMWRQEWLRSAMDGGRKRRFGGKITLLDTSLKEQGTWEFKRGWPCKWDISEFSASKNEIAIETLEIAHDGLLYGIADTEGIYGSGAPTPPATPDMSPPAPPAPPAPLQAPSLPGGNKSIEV